ncbi:MAG: hypothetical protein LBC29_04935 [Propionibacteriaceae bacterium]|jgi:hypothetical protein|nr:hypothetical protein [Propionibacteriaceae bacterium]
MTAFIICAAAGTLALAFSLLFDGLLDVIDLDFGFDHDFDGLSGGWFSLAAVSGFVAGMGFGGIIGVGLGFGPVRATLTGLAFGAAMWYIAVLLYGMFRKLEGKPEEMDLRRVEGQLGTVQTTAKAGDKAIISTTYLGSPRTFMAMMAEDVSVGDEVVVEHLLSADAVSVRKLPSGAYPAM